MPPQTHAAGVVCRHSGGTLAEGESEKLRTLALIACDTLAGQRCERVCAGGAAEERESVVFEGLHRSAPE
jgi:hypothetical protein